jgi:YD repeat-containing protein
MAITDETDAAVQIHTVVQRYRYDAWGNILEVQDPSFKQPYAYTGRICWPDGRRRRGAVPARDLQTGIEPASCAN